LYCFYFGVALALILQTPFTGFGNSMRDSESVCHTGRSEPTMDVGYWHFSVLGKCPTRVREARQS
jgi:hypothetical protein